MWKIFSKNKSVEKTQNDFYFLLEKIVNIALSKTKKGENQSVKEIVDLLRNMFDKFWELKQKNPQKFEQLFWSYDFYKDYVQKQQNSSNTPTLPIDASYRLAFGAERELKGITLFIKSYEKIWKCGFQYENDEVSRYAVYSLSWTLNKIACEPSNRLVIEQFLKIMNSITYEVAKNNKSEYNGSVYTAAIYWYFETVFWIDGNKKEKFDLSYLELFNEKFFFSLQIIISNNQESIFKAFVAHSYDSIFLPLHPKNGIWEYASLDFKILELKEVHSSEVIKHVEDLKKEYTKEDIELLEKELYTKEDLELYLEKVTEISAIYTTISNQEIKTKAKQIESELKEFAIHQFKFNRFLSIVFNIASYSIFKEKLDYIKYLWEYKQPSDAKASFVGHDISPNTIRNLFRIYITSKSQDIFEDHHGIELYRKKYLLLLLTKLHVHFNQDLDLGVSSSIGTDNLEKEYLFAGSILDNLPSFSITFDILINESAKWDFLLQLKKEIKEEYQLEYERIIVKIPAKNQFEMTKKWLLEKRDGLEKERNEIETFLPIDEDKISASKKEILNAYQENEILSKIVTVIKIIEPEASYLELIQIVFKEMRQKHCFLKVSDISCSTIWHHYGKTLASDEVEYFVDTIVNAKKIERIYCGSMNESSDIYQAIVKAIDSLKKCDFVPSILLLHRDYFYEISKRRTNQNSPFYRKLSDTNNFLILENYTIELISINSYRNKKFENIILLDNKVCEWCFEPSTEENERVHIKVSEDTTCTDEVDMEVKTIANLQIKDTNGIKIIERTHLKVS